LYYSEIPFCLSHKQLGGEWDQDDFIPYPHFFERLVNHVLKTFLNKKSNSVTKKGDTEAKG
jgi:hypothetical protein